MRKNILTFLFLITFSVSVSAETVIGTFQTEANDEGAFLKVKFEPCKNDKNLSCATILKAYKSKDNVNKSYEHLGKIIVADMEYFGDGKFQGGTIWDPSKDQLYESKMSRQGDALNVEGCVRVIFLICRSQIWEKVEN